MREIGLGAGRAHRLALQRFEERGLLAADIGPGAPVDIQVEVVPAAAGVLPQETLVVRLVQGPLQRIALVYVLTPARDNSLPSA